MSIINVNNINGLKETRSQKPLRGTSNHAGEKWLLLVTACNVSYLETLQSSD